ncbi:MAG: RNA polymerase subunit sigma-70, partial [Oscillospiraceae bacterium]|nr:RNA polymerase subunit sigma-70 [Oscillospiraceae bacterium]
MTAKEFLSQAYRLDQRINSDIAEITRLREMACSISSPSWEDKVQTSRNTDAPFVRCLEKIMDLEQKVNDEIDTLIDLKRQIRVTI